MSMNSFEAWDDYFSKAMQALVLGNMINEESNFSSSQIADIAKQTADTMSKIREDRINERQRRTTY